MRTIGCILTAGTLVAVTGLAVLGPTGLWSHVDSARTRARDWFNTQGTTLEQTVSRAYAECDTVNSKITDQASRVAVDRATLRTHRAQLDAWTTQLNTVTAARQTLQARIDSNAFTDEALRQARADAEHAATDQETLQRKVAAETRVVAGIEQAIGRTETSLQAARAAAGQRRSDVDIEAITATGAQAELMAEQLRAEIDTTTSIYTGGQSALGDLRARAGRLTAQIEALRQTRTDLAYLDRYTAPASTSSSH